jgi:hypothetical protein
MSRMLSVIGFGIDKYGTIGTGKVGLQGTTLRAAGHVHLLWNHANKKMIAGRRWCLLGDPKWQIPNTAKHGDDFVQTVVGVCRQERFVLCSSLEDESSLLMVWLHSSGPLNPMVRISEELLSSVTTQCRAMFSDVSEESGTHVFRVIESGLHGCWNNLNSLIYPKMKVARFRNVGSH